MINNFPIDIFPDSEETLGIILDSSTQEYEITNNEEYIYHVMMCAYHQMTLHKLKHYKKTQILEIDTQNIHSAQFDINFTARKNLHDIGYQTTLKYFTDVADSGSPAGEEPELNPDPARSDSDGSS